MHNLPLIVSDIPQKHKIFLVWGRWKSNAAAGGQAMYGSVAHSGIRTVRVWVLAFRFQKTEKIPAWAADVYRGHLHSRPRYTSAARSGIFSSAYTPKKPEPSPLLLPFEEDNAGDRYQHADKFPPFKAGLLHSKPSEQFD